MLAKLILTVTLFTFPRGGSGCRFFVVVRPIWYFLFCSHLPDAAFSFLPCLCSSVMPKHWKTRSIVQSHTYTQYLAYFELVSCRRQAPFCSHDLWLRSGMEFSVLSFLGKREREFAAEICLFWSDMKMKEFSSRYRMTLAIAIHRHATSWPHKLWLYMMSQDHKSIQANFLVVITHKCLAIYHPNRVSHEWSCVWPLVRMHFTFLLFSSALADHADDSAVIDQLITVLD